MYMYMDKHATIFIIVVTVLHTPSPLWTATLKSYALLLATHWERYNCGMSNMALATVKNVRLKLMQCPTVLP